MCDGRCRIRIASEIELTFTPRPRHRRAVGSLTIAWITGLALPSIAAPAAARQAIDATEAAAVFAEARAVGAGGDTLWGAPLYGPMLLVDPASRSVVANMADGDGMLEARAGVYVGVLPEGVGVANTAVEWAGRTWTMLIWPLPRGRWSRSVLMVHELFHRVQREVGLPAADAANSHLDGEAARTWLRLEWRALQDALGASGEARRSAIADALAFRARRHAAAPEGVADERRLELNEGLAEYTGVRTALPAEARAGWAAKQLDDHEARALTVSVVRNFAYASGPAYGVLLDASGVPWRSRVREVGDLGALLAEAWRVDVAAAAPAADARLAAYDGARVVAEEAERAQLRERQLAAFRARFETGPTLTLPVREEFGYSFNPNAVASFGDDGTVYLTAEVRDTWGLLRVTDGGVLLIRANGAVRRVVVPAPADASARPPSGDGWTLELSDGWRLAPGERPGDLVVVRTDVR